MIFISKNHLKKCYLVFRAVFQTNGTFLMQRQLLFVHASVANGANDFDTGVVHGVDAEVLALRDGAVVVPTVLQTPPVSVLIAGSSPTCCWVFLGFARIFNIAI